MAFVGIFGVLIGVLNIGCNGNNKKSDSGSIGGPWVVELLILLARGGAFFSCLIVTHSKG